MRYSKHKIKKNNISRTTPDFFPHRSITIQHNKCSLCVYTISRWIHSHAVNHCTNCARMSGNVYTNRNGAIAALIHVNMRPTVVQLVGRSDGRFIYCMLSVSADENMHHQFGTRTKCPQTTGAPVEICMLCVCVLIRFGVCVAHFYSLNAVSCARALIKIAWESRTIYVVNT